MDAVRSLFILMFMLGASASGAEPRSAIDWLATSLQNAPADEASNTTTPVTDDQGIRVEELGTRSIDGTGILTGAMTQLPVDLWAEVGNDEAAQATLGTPYGGPPSLRRLFRRILLAETNPPLEKTNTPDFLLARIDTLLHIGALEEANALILAAEPSNGPLFQRWFNASLLTGTVDAACDRLANSPMLAPVKRVRIYCLARRGDWEAADIAMTAAVDIGALSADDETLLALFLDPLLAEEIDPPPEPVRLDSLTYVLREATGLPISRGKVPIAFLHTDLADFIPIRFRMDAAERLTRAGALEPGVLFQIYREETPAASGGIWDRAAVVQEIDDTIDSESFAETLRKLDNRLAPEGLRVAAAQAFADRLATIKPADVAPDHHDLVGTYLMLAGRREAAAPWIGNSTSKRLTLAAGLTTASADTSAPAYPTARALQLALTAEDPLALIGPDRIQQLNRGRLGLVLLDEVARMAGSNLPDANDITVALAVFRVAGQHELARQIAIEILLDGEQLTHVR